MAAHHSVEPEADSAQRLALCPGTRDGKHRLFVVGYLQGPRPDGITCEKPLLAVCREPSCSHRVVMQCRNHRETRCKPCSSRYRRNLTRLAADGIDRRSRSGYQGMLTLTGPGDPGHNRWRLTRSAEVRVCGCDKHMASGPGVWNASAARRWNQLRTALAREYPGLIYLRAVEVQKRGVIHLHVIIWTPKPMALQRVQTLALAAGFGCNVQWAPCVPGSRQLAYYVAKYVTKATDSRDDCPWDVVNTYTGEIIALPTARYRTWSCSRTWGMTMKQLEEAIRLHAARRRQAAREAAAEDPAGQLPQPPARECATSPPG